MAKKSRAALVDEFIDWIDSKARLDVRSSPAYIVNSAAKKTIANMLADKYPEGPHRTSAFGASDADLFGVLNRLRSLPHSPLFMSPGQRNDAIRLAAVAAKNPTKIDAGSDTYLIRQMTAVERLRHQNENGEVPFRLKDQK
jgi:hypothetical protein